jgi:hypothetical protein
MNCLYQWLRDIPTPSVSHTDPIRVSFTAIRRPPRRPLLYSLVNVAFCSWSMPDNSSILLSSKAQHPSNFHQLRHWLVKWPIHGTKARKPGSIGLKPSMAIPCNPRIFVRRQAPGSAFEPYISPVANDLSSCTTPCFIRHWMIIFLDHNPN